MRSRLPARIVEERRRPFSLANLFTDIPARCAMVYNESPERTFTQALRRVLILSPTLPYSLRKESARALNVCAVIA